MEEFLSMQGAAKKMGVSHGTIRNWVRDGLPHYRIKNVVRIDPEDLKAYLNKYYITSKLCVDNAVDSLLNLR